MTRRGHTLIEVLVASLLLALILSMLLSTWRMMDRASLSQQALREGRQQARTMLTLLVADVQNATLIWSGNTTVNGHVYQVPSPGPALPAQGTDLLYALPEVSPGGLLVPGSLTYTVCGVYLRPMSPPDVRNPDIQEVVYERFAGIAPARPDEPATIDLAALGAGSPGHSVRIFQPYLPNANWVSVLSPPRAVYFDLTFLRVPSQGPVQTEHLTTEATMRDNN